MNDPTTSWIKFEDRAPTHEELQSDRVVGYFRIESLSGEVTTDHFGKLFWVEEEQSWAIEIFSNALRLTTPGQFNYEPVKPSHWCLVPASPDHPDINGFGPMGALSGLVIYGAYAWLFSTGIAVRGYSRFSQLFEGVFAAAFGAMGASLIWSGICEARN